MKTFSNNYIDKENKMLSELKQVKAALQQKEMINQKLQKQINNKGGNNNKEINKTQVIVK